MAKNPFEGSACAHGATTITPSDTEDLANEARGLWIGGNGDVRVVTRNGDDITFNSAIGGTILPVYVTKVFATGTTASNLRGFY